MLFDPFPGSILLPENPCVTKLEIEIVPISSSPIVVLFEILDRHTLQITFEIT